MDQSTLAVTAPPTKVERQEEAVLLQFTHRLDIGVEMLQILPVLKSVQEVVLGLVVEEGIQPQVTPGKLELAVVLEVRE